MSRTSLAVIGLLVGVGAWGLSGRAQEPTSGEPGLLPIEAPVSEAAVRPAVPQAGSRYGEPTPAVQPSTFQQPPTTAPVLKRPSAAERLQQVREGQLRPTGTRGAAKGTVIGPVTADPAALSGPPAELTSPALSAPETATRGEPTPADDPASSRSVLKSRGTAPASEPSTTARRAPRTQAAEGNSKGSGPSAPRPATSSAGASKGTTKGTIGASASGPQKILSSRGPSVRVETHGPKAIKIGVEAVYSIQVHNDGDVEATDVFVRVGVPQAAKAVAEGATAEGSPSGDAPGEQRMVWTIPQLPPRGTETLTLRITPTTAQAIDLFVDWTVRPISAVAQIEVQKPELEMSVFGPKDIAYGEAAKYTIRLTNPGSGAADRVRVEFSYGQEKLDAKEIGSLAAGQTHEVSLELTARQAGALPVVAVATAEGGLRAEASQEVLVRRAALEVEVTGDEVVFAGSPANYRVVVRNAGNAPASQVVATIALPEGSRVARSSEEAKASAGALTWNLGTLPPNGERQLDLQCLLATAGENAVRAEAVAATDLTASNSFVTRVEALADLKLAVNDPPGPIGVGQDAVYEIHVSNRGTKVATKVNVVAHFSAGIEPVEATGAPAELGNGQVVFQPIPRVDPGQDMVLIVRAKASSAGPKRCRVEVTSDESDTQLVGQETTYFYAEPAARTSKVPTPATRR